MKKLIKTLEELKSVHLTEEEKTNAWSGILRRASDFPDGKLPSHFKERARRRPEDVFERKDDFMYNPEQNPASESN